jgi:hypothetical protein
MCAAPEPVTWVNLGLGLPLALGVALGLSFPAGEEGKEEEEEEEEERRGEVEKRRGWCALAWLGTVRLGARGNGRVFLYGEGVGHSPASCHRR